MENPDYSDLEARMGREILAERLLKQAGKSARLVHQGEGIFRLERFFPLDSIVAFCLALSGLGGRAHRNFLDVRITTREWILPRLPSAFEGFRLLQLRSSNVSCAGSPMTPPSSPGISEAKPTAITARACARRPG